MTQGRATIAGAPAGARRWLRRPEVAAAGAIRKIAGIASGNNRDLFPKSHHDGLTWTFYGDVVSFSTPPASGRVGSENVIFIL